MTPVKSSETTEIELSPNYSIPIFLVVAAVAIALVQIWVAAAIALFGLFLMFQTVTIRLRFTETALDIYRSEELIRRFPYTDWLNWKIFWRRLPILFYFKEISSIHFLPVLFDPKMLEIALEKHCPRQD